MRTNCAEDTLRTASVLSNSSHSPLRIPAVKTATKISFLENSSTRGISSHSTSSSKAQLELNSCSRRRNLELLETSFGISKGLKTLALIRFSSSVSSAEWLNPLGISKSAGASSGFGKRICSTLLGDSPWLSSELVLSAEIVSC